MGTERRTHRAFVAVLLVVLLAVGTVGCTMCPDPFDYSGPVPDGSAPQNDFWARSNGILPLRRGDGTWPPVVAEPPTEATESVLKVAEEPSESKAE